MTGGQKGESRWQSSCTTTGLSIQTTRQPKQGPSFRAHDAKPSDNLIFETLRSSGMPWFSKACREAISNEKEPSANTALQTDLSCGFLKCFVQRGRIVQVQRSRLWLLSFACATETGCGRWGWPLPLLLVACQPLHAGLMLDRLSGLARPRPPLKAFCASVLDAGSDTVAFSLY